MDDNQESKKAKSTIAPATTAKRDASASAAMIRRFGIDPEKITEKDCDQLRQFGIDANTHERKALTWAGALLEFGRPIGPRLYNAVHTAAFGPVPPGRNDINLMSLEDKWISPRRSDPTQRNFETEADFEERKRKFAARRARVHELIADAEREAAKGGK